MPPVTPETTTPEVTPTPEAGGNEAKIEQIIQLISELPTEDQINLLGLLNGQFNVVSEETKNSPAAADARAAEMANVF